MKQFYTYLHCKPDGSPFYVGKGFGNRSHNIALNRNQHHKNIVEKYGRKNIGIFVFACHSEEEAFADEKQQIAQLRASGESLVNQTDGGQGPSGRRHSEMAREKISISKKGKRRRPFSKETIEKMSAAQSGRKIKKEQRLAMSKITKRLWSDPNYREKVSASHIGNKNHLGHKHTAETLAAISSTRIRLKLHKGEKNGYAKLDDNKVREIRKRISLGEEQKSIAQSMGVCIASIGRIKRGQAWTHIEEVKELPCLG